MCKNCRCGIDIAAGMLYTILYRQASEGVVYLSEVLLYRKISDSLRSRIFSGELKPGDMLPSENMLCQSFGVSRETVRKGLKLLENEGLIYTRNKVGNFVCVPNHSDFTLNFTEERDGFKTQFLEVHGMRPDAELCRILEIGEKQLLITFSQLTRDRAGLPVAYDIKYVPYERSMPTVEKEMRFTIYSVPDISGVEPFDYYTTIEVSAVGAPERVARVLGCPEQTPLLLVERLFVRQDGKKLGFSRQYSRRSFGRLHGVSGPKK